MKKHSAKIFVFIAMVIVATSAVIATHAQQAERKIVSIQENTLLLEAPFLPDENSTIVASLWTSEAICLIAEEIRISDGGEYAYIEFSQYPNHPAFSAYVIRSAIKELSDEEAALHKRRIAENPIQDLSEIGIIYAPERAYQMPKTLKNIRTYIDDKMDVYVAPEGKSYKQLNKKDKDAQIYSGTVINLIGKEENWIFVEYPVQTGYRRGYIVKECVSENAYSLVSNIPNSGLSATVIKNTKLSNDPSMQSNTYEMRNLYKDSEVKILGYEHAWYRDWVYVEIRNRRGYIPMNTIQLKTTNKVF